MDDLRLLASTVFSIWGKTWQIIVPSIVLSMPIVLWVLRKIVNLIRRFY